MKDKLILTGMVLLAAPAGEYDKRLVILTKERGRITGFARGARKQNSPILAACNPFVFGEIEVYEGRDAFTIVRFVVKDFFREIAQEPELSAYGFYLLELVNYFTKEGLDGSLTMKLLYVSIRALIKEQVAPSLIRIIFELRLMVIHGIYPDVFQCKNCGSKEALDYFSKDQSGVLCCNCGKLLKGYQVEESTIYALQYMISCKIEQLYLFRVVPKVQKQLEEIVSAMLSSQVDRQFISVQLIHLFEQKPSD